MLLKVSEAGQSLTCSADGSKDLNSSKSEMSESTRYGDGTSVKDELEDAAKDAFAKVSSSSKCMLENGTRDSFSG